LKLGKFIKGGNYGLPRHLIMVNLIAKRSAVKTDLKLVKIS